MYEISYQHYLVGLCAVANNIAAIPLYMNLIEGSKVNEQHRICRIATLTAFLTMVISMFAGFAVLNFFQISLPAFRIAGGLLLLSTGFGMMNSIQKSLENSAQSISKKISTAIIPVGIPMTTGAGTMSTIILFASSAQGKPYMHFTLMGAIVTITVMIYLSFFFSPKILSYLGATGLDVITKIFGLITLALGMQFILTGIAGAFPSIM